MPRIRSLDDLERKRRLRRAQQDLFWLCTEILGYDKLTEDFHKPMLQDMDRQRREGSTRVMELWARGHYKTTVRIGQMIQDLLIDENETIFVCHAVENEVEKIVEECGQHFLRNKELRALKPDMMPAPQNKRWLKALNFTVKRSKYSRQPSVQGKSANAEITGAHCGRIYLDDIVGRNTIMDSQLPKIKSWFRSTVLPVLDPGGTILVTGTRWDIDDPYALWLKEDAWESRVRGALETDGKPDYKGVPVLLTRKELKSRRLSMGEEHFAFQYMNDPTPSGSKPWDAACEQYIGMKPTDDLPGAAGPGTVFVLSDPAPAREGSVNQDGERVRADGTKDDWAIAAVKIKVHNGMQIGVLLDLSTSKEWTRSEGLDEACRMMRKWGTNKFFNESFGGLIADYTEETRKAARRNGVPLYLANGGMLPAFKANYGRNAKNRRFSLLADWARNGRFYICSETMPEKELEKFLDQARHWIPLPNGRNSNRFDDAADVVSRITDPELQRFSPTAQFEPEERTWSPFHRFDENENQRSGTRYVRW